MKYCQAGLSPPQAPLCRGNRLQDTGGGYHKCSPPEFDAKIIPLLPSDGLLTGLAGSLLFACNIRWNGLKMT